MNCTNVRLIETSKKILLLPPIPVKGCLGAGGCPGISGGKVGTNHGQNAFTLQGTLTQPTLTHTGTIWTHQFNSRAHLWDMGGD